MMFATYDTQSSHAGYIDFEFKELHDGPEGELLTDKELFELILDGYYYDGECPKYMQKVFNYEGNIKAARVSKRLVKRWCERN